MAVRGVLAIQQRAVAAGFPPGLLALRQVPADAEDGHERQPAEQDIAPVNLQVDGGNGLDHPISPPQRWLLAQAAPHCAADGGQPGAEQEQRGELQAPASYRQY